MSASADLRWGLRQGPRVVACRKQLALDPGNPWHASNLANALWLEDALAEALSWARWATRGGGGSGAVHPLAWRCLGNVLLDLGCYGEADAAYRLADPAGANAADQFNRSKAAWGEGAHGEAWRLAEARLRLDPLPDGVRPGPWWQGWPEVPVVTLWAEQGLGDTVQFVRWLPALLARGQRVELLVPPALQPLLEQGLAWMGEGLRVRSCLEAEVGRPLGGCHGSLLSLPWRLGLPEPPVPPGGYLRLSGRRLAAGAAREGPLRLGLVWGAGRYLDGHSRERDYRRKSVRGEALRRLLAELAQRPVELVKLQVGPDRDLAEQQGTAWAGVLDAEADLLGLAEALLQLDLLVCVDTAAAHVAGALGVPAWVLLPWAAASRWGRQTAISGWYPSLRLWRQPRHGDWLGLWPALGQALDDALAAGQTAGRSPADPAGG